VYQLVEREGVALHTAPELLEAHGVLVAFSERGGGTSSAPYSSLNRAAHGADDPGAVDANRDRLCAAAGVSALRDRLTTAIQVHATPVSEVTGANAGSGAFVSRAPAPVGSSDVLWTRQRGVPLLMLYADCVPVVLVRPSVPAVAVVHAGWHGAAAGVVSAAAKALAALPGREDDALALVGAHIGACCYEVGSEVVAAFRAGSHSGNSFVTITAASSRLDLGAVVAADLERSGVPKERQWHLGICTAHNTDRFYSYRTEGLTGRHGALAVIL
jgi:hypothetical protein